MHNKVEIIVILLGLFACKGVSGLLGCALTCPVGATVTGLLDVCTNDNDNNACSIGCGRLFGAVCGASCVRRDNGQSECVCNLDCAIAGEWGDPHYWTFDMFQFGYQGLCKHTVHKQCQKSKSFPNYELRFTNAPWIPGAPTSGVSKIELVVPDWIGLKTVEISAGQGLMINGYPSKTPYKYSYTPINNDGKPIGEQSITVTSNLLEDTISTSFGLNIIAQKLASYDVYMWSFVMIPAHPEMKGNTCGMLGNWDNDPTNDIKDRNGSQSIADPAFSWLYGQSWCLTKDDWLDPVEQLKRAQTLASNINLCDVSVKGAVDAVLNPFGAIQNAGQAIESRVRSSCRKLMDTRFAKCEFALWMATSLESCVMDMCSMKNQKDQDTYVCQMINTMNRLCKTNVPC